MFDLLVCFLSVVILYQNRTVITCLLYTSSLGTDKRLKFLINILYFDDCHFAPPYDPVLLYAFNPNSQNRYAKKNRIPPTTGVR